MCWQRRHATFLVKTWVRRQPLTGAQHGNGCVERKVIGPSLRITLEMQSTHTSCLLFLLLLHICQYTSIYIILFVVLFRYFLTFKKHILGFQKQWSGQALMDLRLLTPLHMWVLICSGEMHGMGYQKDCLGRRIAGFYFQRSLASSTSCFFYREHILLTWKKKLFSPPPLPSKLPEGVGWLPVPILQSSLPPPILWSPGWQGPQEPSWGDPLGFALATNA